MRYLFKLAKLHAEGSGERSPCYEKNTAIRVIGKIGNVLTIATFVHLEKFLTDTGRDGEVCSESGSFSIFWFFWNFYFSSERGTIRCFLLHIPNNCSMKLDYSATASIGNKEKNRREKARAMATAEIGLLKSIRTFPLDIRWDWRKDYSILCPTLTRNRVPSELLQTQCLVEVSIETSLGTACQTKCWSGVNKLSWHECCDLVRIKKCHGKHG